MYRGFLYEVVDGIGNDLDDLNSNAMECDKNGDCVAESEEFKKMLQKMKLFIKRWE